MIPAFIRTCIIVVVLVIEVVFIDSKRTVYYWKYTAHHINQPLQKMPVILDAIV